jgi:4-diphosphocytidyl-2-C-methyl-D-erythritol kinase
MIDFPQSKINLGLKVTGKRPDGFHDIETVFYPAGMSDILEIIVAGDGRFGFTSTGLAIPGDPQHNLCVKAYHLLSAGLNIPPVKIHLHKIIPMGAGLGGGSSDGAFTVKMLNTLFSLGLSVEIMEDYARQLGSDCAFFIRNRPVLATGKGDIFEPVTIDLSAFRIVIAVPSIHVNTAEAYAMIDKAVPLVAELHQNTTELIKLPPGNWKSSLTNDFERPVFAMYPEIARIKEQLYRSGALYSAMTGSGAGVYGIFERDADIPDFEGCFVWQSG